MACDNQHPRRRSWARRCAKTGSVIACAILLAVTSALIGCEEEAKTAVLVRVLVDDELHRPEYLLIQWWSPDARARAIERVPAVGYLPVEEAPLATVSVVLGNEMGERRVVVKGMRNGMVVSMAAARVPWLPGERQRLSLTLGDVLPDGDTDGLPDVVDD